MHDVAKWSDTFQKSCSKRCKIFKVSDQFETLGFKAFVTMVTCRDCLHICWEELFLNLKIFIIIGIHWSLKYNQISNLNFITKFNQTMLSAKSLQQNYLEQKLFLVYIIIVAFLHFLSNNIT